MTQTQPSTIVAFQAEPLARLRARFPAALEHTFDPRTEAPGTVSGFRRQAFDHEDGLRLLVSVDRQPRGRVLHVSASVERGTAAWSEMERLAGETEGLDVAGAVARLRQIAHWIRERTQQLAGFELGPPIHTIHGLGGAPHLFFREPPAIVLPHVEAQGEDAAPLD